MFELVISTVLVDGSEHTVVLTVPSLLEFERLHTVSVIKAIDQNLSMEYLTTLAYLAMKQVGHVSNIEKFPSELKGVSYQIKPIPFWRDGYHGIIAGLILAGIPYADLKEMPQTLISTLSKALQDRNK